MKLYIDGHSRREVDIMQWILSFNYYVTKKNLDYILQQ